MSAVAIAYMTTAATVKTGCADFLNFTKSTNMQIANKTVYIPENEHESIY